MREKQPSQRGAMVVDNFAVKGLPAPSEAHRKGDRSRGKRGAPQSAPAIRTGIAPAPSPAKTMTSQEFKNTYPDEKLFGPLWKKVCRLGLSTAANKANEAHYNKVAPIEIKDVSTRKGVTITRVTHGKDVYENRLPRFIAKKAGKFALAGLATFGGLKIAGCATSTGDSSPQPTTTTLAPKSSSASTPESSTAATPPPFGSEAPTSTTANTTAADTPTIPTTLASPETPTAPTGDKVVRWQFSQAAGGIACASETGFIQDVPVNPAQDGLSQIAAATGEAGWTAGTPEQLAARYAEIFTIPVNSVINMGDGQTHLLAIPSGCDFSGVAAQTPGNN